MILMIIDQTNIYQRLKNRNKSNTDNNEDLNSDLKSKDQKEKILIVNIEGRFTKEQLKNILKKKIT